MEALLVLLGLFFVVGVPILALRANWKIGDLQREIADLRMAVGRLQTRAAELSRTPSIIPPTPPQPVRVAPAPVIVRAPEPVIPQPATKAPPPPPPPSPPTIEDEIAAAKAKVIAASHLNALSESIAEPLPTASEALPTAPVTPAPAAPEPEPVRRAAPPPEPPRRARAVTRQSFEFKLGGGIFIWIGAVMLALAGAFLVKYSIDEGLLSPPIRVGLGIVMGFGLLGAGQWLRKQSPSIAQALAAAAVADWFASLFAATALYHLLPPAFGFVLLAIVTAAGIALALREGPLVGLIGIAGGFITPAIVHADAPRAEVLFAYLFLIQIGTLVLQHKRGWWYLTALGIGGGLLWAVGWVGLYYEARLGAVWLPLFLVATDLAQLWSLYGKGGVPITKEMTLTARAASAACFLIMAAWLILGGHHFDDWAFLVLMLVAHCAAGRRFAREEVPALVGAAIVVATFATWSPFGFDWTAPFAVLDRTSQILAVGLALGVAYGLGGFWFEHSARNPTRWAGLSTIGTAFLFGGAYLDLDRAALWLPWSAIAVILAGLHAVAAWRLQQLRRDRAIYTGALGLHILATSGFLALAVPMQFKHEWIAVSWAIELPVMAWVTVRLDLPWVRRGIWTGGALVIAAVLLSGFEAGEGLIFNRLLYGIGVPCAGMIATAQILKRGRDDRENRLLVMILHLAGAALLALLVGLEIDHFIGRVAPDSGRNLMRAGAAAIAWGGLAFGLYRVHRRENAPERGMLYAAHGFTILACIALIGGCFVAYNPLFSEIDVGQTLLFNRLLLAYAGPAAILLLVADEMRRQPAAMGGAGSGQALASLAFATASCWIALTARQILHGSLLNIGPVTDIEAYLDAAGWGLLLPAMAWMGARGFSWLKQGLLAGIVLIFGAIAVSGLPAGEWLLFNSPLYGIGLPALGMLGAAAVVQRAGAPKDARLILTLKLAASALLALLIGVEVYQFVGRFVTDSGTGLMRASVMSIAWAAVALGLLHIHRRRPDLALHQAAAGFTLAACAAMAICGFFQFNPLLSAIEVGEVPILNRLLLAYAAPAVLLLLVADALRQQALALHGRVPAQVLAMFAFAIAFLWVATAIRQIGHGTLLVYGPSVAAEAYGIAAGWALLLPAMTWCAQRRGFPLLHHAVWAGAALVLLAILLSGLPSGMWLILNPPLYGVGIPSVAMLVTALMLKRTGMDQGAEQSLRAQVLALELSGGALLALLVWQEMGPIARLLFSGSGADFLQSGLASIAWAGIALGLLKGRDRLPASLRRLFSEPLLDNAAYAFTALTGAAVVVGGMLALNPLLRPIEVGGLWVVNSLLAVYAIPAALLLLLADELRRALPQKQWPRETTGLLGLVIGFVWVSVTVRQMAHGSIIAFGPVTDPEQYGYSAAWTLYGLLLLGLGTWKRSQVLRYASAVVILLTVTKVFLIDASDLTGLYRVASFLGLGLSLIGIGYLYQRLLFRRREE